MLQLIDPIPYHSILPLASQIVFGAVVAIKDTKGRTGVEVLEGVPEGMSGFEGGAGNLFPISLSIAHTRSRLVHDRS